MPKVKVREAVLQDWVLELTFQMQALLLTAMRGPDENNKFNSAKSIVRYLRGVVLKPAGHIILSDNDNDFMWGDYRRLKSGSNCFMNCCLTFWSDHDEYPHHFIMHLVHCAEVVGYKHPDYTIRGYWNLFYVNACEQFHMNPESEQEMDLRLNDFGTGVHNSNNNLKLKKTINRMTELKDKLPSAEDCIVQQIEKMSAFRLSEEGTPDKLFRCFYFAFDDVIVKLMFKQAMHEYCKQVIDVIAKEAKVKEHRTIPTSSGTAYFKVDKESILKFKEILK